MKTLLYWALLLLGALLIISPETREPLLLPLRILCLVGWAAFYYDIRGMLRLNFAEAHKQVRLNPGLAGSVLQTAALLISTYVAF